MGFEFVNGPCGLFKASYSLVLLVFSIVVVLALIFEEQTFFSQGVHSVFAFAILWISLIWLALVEGGQASMVGLPPIDRQLYKDSHTITFRICERGHKGDNLDRYLMGRQFMVLALVFLINSSGAPMEEDANVLGFPTVLADIFIKSGLALILITCMIGQLTTQVNASHCMLDFINTWGNWFTVQVAMAIEASGLLHASYFIQMMVCKLAQKPLESNEPPKTGCSLAWYWIQIVYSLGILIFAFVATFAALFAGKTTMWDAIPEAVTVILFFVLMAVVGMLEGMQIAFFAVAKLTEEERSSSIWAKRTCELLFRDEGRNLPGFMVGRQLCVVACFFFIARVTTMDVQEGEANVLGVPDGVQEFFNTGLLGALITTIVASIAWQLIASAFPLAFLSTPVTYVLLSICLLLEATGLCDGVWVLAALHKKLAGFQKDEVYVGTAEERAETSHGDRTTTGANHVGAGHLAGGSFPANYDLPVPEFFRTGTTPQRRRKICLANIEELREQLEQAETPEDRVVYQTALRKETAALRRVNWEEKEISDRFFSLSEQDTDAEETASASIPLDDRESPSFPVEDPESNSSPLDLDEPESRSTSREETDPTSLEEPSSTSIPLGEPDESVLDEPQSSAFNE